MAAIPSASFDGTNDYMTRGADLTGNADGKTMTFSFWFKMLGGDSALQRIFRSAAGNVVIHRTAANTIVWNLFATAAVILDGGAGAVSSGTYIADATWHHCMGSVDTNATVIHWYIDNTAQPEPTVANEIIDNADTDHSIGATTAGAAKLNADLAEFWLTFGQYIDLSVANNRLKFISSSNKPAILGPTGNFPTGTAPLIYLKGPAATFPTNLGTGGNFSVTGTLTDGTTIPIKSDVFRQPPTRFFRRRF